jgi:hypothetical protein
LFFKTLIIYIFLIQVAVASPVYKPLVEPSLKISLYSKFLNAAGLYKDEVLINFGDSYNNAIDSSDILKTNFSSDNLAIQKNNYQFSQENRKPLTQQDTVLLKLSNTQIGNYYFEIEPRFIENLYTQAFIKDKYLLTETQVSFANINSINFSINADAASKATDRFYIFLRPAIPAGPLSVTFLSLSAINNADKTNVINWKVAIEVNLENYQTEKGTNPNNFTKFGNNILPTGGGNAASYFQTDENPAKGINYYRIKATSTNGQIHYSNIVKLEVVEKNDNIIIYPNPAIGNNIYLHFNNMPGKYIYNVINGNMQIIAAGNIQITKSIVQKNIQLNSTVTHGLYRIIMTNEYGKNFTSTFTIQ